MKVQLGKQTGLALALLSTLLAALLAMGAFSVAQAQQTSHTVTRSLSETMVAPGAEIVVTIQLDVQNGGVVNETLPEGFRFVSSDHILLSETDDGAGFVIGRAVNATSFTYTVTASDMAGEYTFEGEFVARDGTVVPYDDSTVTVVAATNGNGETDSGQVELSTYNAGADVTVDIDATADDSIRGGTDVEVSLEDFGIPSSIDEGDVILDGGTGSYYGNPEDVSVSGDTITITMPTRVSGTNEEAVISGSYSIRFKSAAGLSNPTSAGDKDITVSDADADDETSTVTIVKTSSVKPTFVTRGGEATVTAKGLRDGATTVYLLEMNDDGDYVRGAALGTGTAEDGVVEIAIDTSGSALVADATADDDEDVGVNKLRVIDSNDASVGNDFMLGIKPTVKLGSETAKRSANLEISVSDWYYGDIDSVTIAGLNADFVGDDVESIDVGSDDKATFKVIVPGNVRTGDQEVKVYGDDEDLNTTSATATVDIVVLPLEVSPSKVVPGHRVTISGSGFANSSDVTGITIGGKDVAVPDDADSTSSGKVSVTVAVPLNVGDGDKSVKLTVGSRTGEGEITVPEPEITLDPATSVPGSVISVRGTGFASDERVEVRFDGDIEAVGLADGSGDFHIRLEIPSGAGVGATNPIKVDVRNPLEEDHDDYVDIDISAEADHKTPGSAITVPETAQVGVLAAISGSNFEPFRSLTVTIGGNDVTPTNAETDKNGGFELEARVPRLSAGSHTITVKDSAENSVTETFRVVLTAIVSTPEEVFGDLGDALIVVWRYDNPSATWASYSPDAPAELNDLTGVSRGNIVWIQVSERVEFQGGDLFTGWNLIALE